MKTTNRTVLDLSKVQHGSFWYVNQYGQIKQTDSKPAFASGSIRCEPIWSNKLAMYHPDHIGESEYGRAKRLGLLDVWTPVVQFQLAANHNVVYTGDKAKAMWKAWNERIFNQQQKQKKGKK